METNNLTAVDTQILVYAHREDAPKHEGAKRKIEGLRVSDTPWAIP